MLIPIFRSATSLVQRVSTAQLQRNNVPLLEMLVVKVLVIWTLFYQPVPTTQLGLEVPILVSHLTLQARVLSYLYLHRPMPNHMSTSSI